MQCNHCRNRMYQTGEIVERRARQTWFRCPVCDRVHTTSEPYRLLPTRQQPGRDALHILD